MPGYYDECDKTKINLADRIYEFIYQMTQKYYVLVIKTPVMYFNELSITSALFHRRQTVPRRQIEPTNRHKGQRSNRTSLL